MSAIETGWGLDWILWFQAWRTSLIGTLAVIFHHLGSEYFYLAFPPLIFWCVDVKAGRRLAIFFMLNSWLNSGLKSLFRRPRPFWKSSEVRPLVEESSYGIPSGHAQNATALWGGIAVEAKRWWATVAVVIYVLLMALSRMVAGVHFPQDVIGGVLVGLVMLGLYAWIGPRLETWLGRQNLWVQIGVTVVAVALMLILCPLLIPVSSPPWLAEPLPLDELMSGPGTPAGALLGMGIGLALETRYVRFDARGVWWKRVLRYVVGVAGLLVLYFGLKILFDDLQPALVFRLVRYSLVGLWAALLAPWVFVKTGLAGTR